VRVIALSLALCVACSTGGQYVPSERAGQEDARGETNGRMFDFVSNMPEGDDWQIRVRDNSLWAAYGDGEKTEDLGTANLTSKEAGKLWELVDAVEIPDRKKGKRDEDEGYVQLRLREPGDEQHEIFLIYVSRATAADDEEVLALAEYLQKLIEKHFKKKPEF
jgi:hypothetical protein